MNRVFVQAVAVGAAMATVSCAKAQQSGEPPRLVVVISVDQMRAEYLTRFVDQWTAGLAKLVRDGAVFTEAYHDHAFTKTAAGHATIATGVFPSRHGIVHNEWWDRTTHRPVSAGKDAASPIIGYPEAKGRSPAHLQREAIGDWLKRASPRAKVFSVALKGRVALFLAGKRPDGAYWYSPESGRYVTSTYYGDEYPTWVQAFNDSGRPDAYLDSVWTRLLPEAAYNASREDDFSAEALGSNYVFPHTFVLADNGGASRYSELQYTPFGDELTFAFARALIEYEDLGADNIPDLLFVGASAADKIGHRYGPYSQEVHDYYLRLDRMLGNFLAFLDERIGADKYVVVLCADHGAMPLPEELTRKGIDAKRIRTKDLQDALVPLLGESLLEHEITATPRPPFVYSFGVVIDFPDGPVDQTKLRALHRSVAEQLQKMEFIEETFTYDEMLAGTAEGQFVDSYRRSFHPERAADIMILFKKHYLYWTDLTVATDHGTPYSYDSHVPIIFFGPGIAAGVHRSRVRTVDIAPTVATLLGITAPDDLDGSTLDQAIK